jgi:hypothetical protein
MSRKAETSGMTVNLNIKPGLEARLVARARAIGLSLERFIENVLEREATASGTNGSHSLPGGDKAKAFRGWANSFPAELPVLSLEDVSRESVCRRD